VGLLELRLTLHLDMHILSECVKYITFGQEQVIDEHGHEWNKGQYNNQQFFFQIINPSIQILHQFLWREKTKLEKCHLNYDLQKIANQPPL